MTQQEYYQQKNKIIKDKKLSIREKEMAKWDLWCSYIFGDSKPKFNNIGII